MNNQNTQDIGIIHESNIEVSDILEQVYEALSEKGYNPVSQIVGYVMSGDPTYITSYKNARSLIMKAERDEIIEVLLENYKRHGSSKKHCVVFLLDRRSGTI